jgi:HWE histidine kinase/PAS fold
VEYRIVRSDGEVRWTERRCFVSYNSDARPQRVVGVSIDITERKRAEEARKILNAELDHRVKNPLATVTAVISHTQQGSRSVADFAAALEGRIRSMAATHELLSSRHWQELSLIELIRCELAPYAASKNTEISGLTVLLKPEAGQALAMVLPSPRSASSGSTTPVSHHSTQASRIGAMAQDVSPWSRVHAPLPVARAAKRVAQGAILRPLASEPSRGSHTSPTALGS